MSPEIILPEAVLLDMDGTLTEPLLDFPRIKAEMGIGTRPILEAMAGMGPAELAAAEAVLSRHEERAARESALNPGCRQLLGWLDRRRVPTALVTRNSAVSVKRVLGRHGLRIETVVARDDAPPKPSPAPLLLACLRLGVAPGRAWMVGDGQYDIEAGIAAGVPTVWVSHGRRPKPFAAEPWVTVADLSGVLGMLQAAYSPLR